MLVQYINSPTYPDGKDGQGAPAEVIVPPVEQYQKDVIYGTSPSFGSQSPFLNFVNVITHVNASPSTLFDGQKISGQPHIKVDGVYEITRLKGARGAGSILSDSGVGVYVYGYQNGDA